MYQLKLFFFYQIKITKPLLCLVDNHCPALMDADNRHMGI